ncbi:hypothetical protein P3X46_017534 [Hevea brasiliensis]|uniref:BZIP domain-containing protein n=1 Tax=Hevea brasiliensis TaxID=3981 RepID=A0ABQ9LR40_HEVBR|nr:hypothetical protein P3X46_017534 [Hevea brasiliensis]
MDLDRFSVSSLDSSSSSASSSGSSLSATADRIVRIGTEAAKTLADLAHLAMRESRRHDSGGKWGSKGKQGKKRVKSESPPIDRASNPLIDDSVHSCRDLAAGTSDNFWKTGKLILNWNQYLAEKEARRLRRILANRESARQTIQRRQALCEELTGKAADLAWVNENLNRMAKLIKTEAEESPGDLKSALVEKSTASATNCPLLFYNQHPFSPLCWPSIIQSSNLPDSSQQQQGNPAIANEPRTPLCIVSCPWVFLVPDHGNGIHPLPSLGYSQDGTSVSNQYNYSLSSKAAALTENQLSSSQLVNTLQEKNKDPFILPSKKLVDATAAAEARRRGNLQNLKASTAACQMNC